MKFLIGLVMLLLISGSIILYLAISSISHKETGTMSYKAKLFSKSFVMSNYDRYKNYSADDYGSNILDEDYCLENLNHPYYEEIRNDERLKPFYTKDTFLLKDYLAMKEYLRDLFPHGTSYKSHFNSNLIEMLNATEKGEKFLCGNISKMLCQMIMASGTYARVIRILDIRGRGHVVLEFWSRDLKKWILLDPDYNMHYSDLDSIPLNGMELFIAAKNKKLIIKHSGISHNTLFNLETKLYEKFYSNGIAIDFYNQWVSKNYKRKNPIRSPINSCIYIGLQPDRKMYFKYNIQPTNDSIIKILYENPFEYDHRQCI